MELVSFLPIIVMLGALVFLSSRKQRKTMQATLELQESLRVGDRVHTTSGLQGTINQLTDDHVDLEIAPGVVTRWMKLAIRDRIDPAAADVQSGATELTESDADRLRGD